MLCRLHSMSDALHNVSTATCSVLASSDSHENSRGLEVPFYGLEFKIISGPYLDLTHPLKNPYGCY